MEIPEEYTAKFHQSDKHPALFDGCDQFAYGAVVLGCVFIALSVRQMWGYVLAAVLFFSGRIVLQRMAARDPFLIPIFFRAKRYGKFLLALSPMDR